MAFTLKFRLIKTGGISVNEFDEPPTWSTLAGIIREECALNPSDHVLARYTNANDGQRQIASQSALDTFFKHIEEPHPCPILEVGLRTEMDALLESELDGLFSASVHQDKIFVLENDDFKSSKSTKRKSEPHVFPFLTALTRLYAGVEEADVSYDPNTIAQKRFLERKREYMSAVPELTCSLPRSRNDRKASPNGGSTIRCREPGRHQHSASESDAIQWPSRLSTWSSDFCIPRRVWHLP